MPVFLEDARWIWVSLPHATYGLAVHGGKIAAAPPIAKWAIGKDEHSVAAYLRGKGAVFRALPAPVDGHA